MTSFVFLDVVARRPYKVAQWGGEWWIFRWHEYQKSWASYRKATPEEVAGLRGLAAGQPSQAIRRPARQV